MAAVLELDAQPPRAEILRRLEDLMTARRALIRDRTAVLTRQKVLASRLLQRQAAARLRQIEGHIQEIDAAVADAAPNDPMLSQKLAILIKIQGIAETTAVAMLIEMPELIDFRRTYNERWLIERHGHHSFAQFRRDRMDMIPLAA